MAQPAAGIEGVLDMRLHSIGVVQHCSDAALGPEGRAVGQVALAQYGNAKVAGEVKCQAETGGTAADHQDIMLELLAHVGTLVIFGRGTAQWSRADGIVKLSLNVSGCLYSSPGWPISMLPARLRQPLWELSDMAGNPMKAARTPQFAAATQGGRPFQAYPCVFET